MESVHGTAAASRKGVVEGSLVWAKMSGYPWWPAMVESDPNTGIYYTCHATNNVVSHCHVVFLDKTVSRAWLPVQKLRPYTELKAADLSKTVKQQMTEYQKSLDAAKRNAQRAAALPIAERLMKFSFTANYKPHSDDSYSTSYDDTDTSRDCSASASGGSMVITSASDDSTTTGSSSASQLSAGTGKKSTGPTKMPKPAKKLDTKKKESAGTEQKAMREPKPMSSKVSSVEHKQNEDKKLDKADGIQSQRQIKAAADPKGTDPDSFGAGGDDSLYCQKSGSELDQQDKLKQQKQKNKRKSCSTLEPEGGMKMKKLQVADSTVGDDSTSGEDHLLQEGVEVDKKIVNELTDGSKAKGKKSGKHQSKGNEPSVGSAISSQTHVFGVDKDRKMPKISSDKPKETKKKPKKSVPVDDQSKDVKPSGTDSDFSVQTHASGIEQKKIKKTKSQVAEEKTPKKKSAKNAQVKHAESAIPDSATSEDVISGKEITSASNIAVDSASKSDHHVTSTVLDPNLKPLPHSSTVEISDPSSSKSLPEPAAKVAKFVPAFGKAAKKSK